MNTPLSIEQLKRIEGIMLSMLAEASNANWQELSRLDSERRVLIGYKEQAHDRNDAGHEESAGDPALPASDPESSDNAPQILPASSRSHLTTTPDKDLAVAAPGADYLKLSAELVALDQQIIATVLKARQSVLEQTRGLRAQVSAKNSYEQANIMKVSSYS